MRVWWLTGLVMVSFAANSILNRLALGSTDTGPAAFAALRVASGALMLAILVLARNRGSDGLLGPVRAVGPASLCVYVLGFSFAYVSLDAGVGALILFGGVQVTMFVGAILAREAIPPRRWVGAAVAFGGLAFLMWPAGGAAPSLVGATLMVAAAVGWGVYSLAGRGAEDPLRSTAANFLLAAPLALLVWAAVRDGATPAGVALALVSGMITSGLGYALWYWVLPQLPATVAAVAQLVVPVIAVVGGIVLLGESLSLRLLVSCALVVGGVAFSVVGRGAAPPRMSQPRS